MDKETSEQLKLILEINELTDAELVTTVSTFVESASGLLGTATSYLLLEMAKRFENTL